MATAMIEHSMIGHISGPPARTISHIRTLSSQTVRRKAGSYRRDAPAQGNLSRNPPLAPACTAGGRVPRAMLRRRLQKIVPAPQSLRERWFLRPFGQRLADPQLWTLHRRGVTHAFGAGLAICFVPPAGHLPLPASGALARRGHI